MSTEATEYPKVYGFGRDGHHVIMKRELVWESRPGQEPCSCGLLSMTPMILGGPLLITIDGESWIHRRDLCINRKGYKANFSNMPEPGTQKWLNWSGQ